MNKKKQILLSESYADNIDALGIACSESEFQLSNLLNTNLSLKLTVAPLIIKTIKGAEIGFPSFYFDTEQELEIRLIKNKVNNQIIYPSQQMFDYILFLKGKNTKSVFSQFTIKLKRINEITLVSQLEIKKVAKAKELAQLF